MKPFLLVVFGCFCPLLVPGAATAVSPAVQPFFVCIDYHCDAGKSVTLTRGQWQDVRDLFAEDASPAEERENIRRAVALLEKTVGAITGTWRDRARNAPGEGQLDCISESKNTTTYLNMLSDDGLLKHHQIEARRVRHPWIFDVHWSAVIHDQISGKRYAVDSWFLDNGEPPYVQPLENWLAGQSPEEN